MDELNKQIVLLQEMIRLQKQQIVALRRSLMEARTIIVNECDISAQMKDDYLDWLALEESGS